MKIHEFQAKEIMRRAGLAVPRGIACATAAAVEAAARELGTAVVVVKSQIHAGGRGKGKVYDKEGQLVLEGGVKLARSPEAARDVASKILGNKLVTVQTGPAGKVVSRVYVEEGIQVARELYLGMVVDREKQRVAVMASTEGGVEIEKVAAETPEKILKEWADPAVGIMPYQARRLCLGLGLEGDTLAKAARLVEALYGVFVANDCSLVEVNPLAVLASGDVVAADAKMSFDENALFRHGELAGLEDRSEEDPDELEAAENNLSYVSLDGNVGCLVNGAGLAMATMDIIKHYGGAPANFLDVGGSADAARVTAAFKIILRDPAVKGIFVNIFGGIVRCNVIAEGIIAATKALELKVPLVVRLRGNNEAEGKALLASSGLAITPADTMADGAQKIVALAGKV
ncbi:MAG TPA: ADP-forming succinate--CoA ligase subunit beta [Myxococcota bacterium]|jgi:succinyl-CoA synthetase beta subunit|nr:ADP-forming succinate--CoA ligase subunit beta [Myxococcota bacterium]